MKVRNLFNVRKVTGDIGIEIETEGHNLWKGDDDFWRTEADGSLRGEDSAEYVLKYPLSHDKVKMALLRLHTHLKRSKSTVDLSRRTSTHIHINCTELTFTELTNYLTLLLVFEELLVDWCSPTRKGNLFCLQSKDAMGMLHALRKFVETKITRSLGDNIRYSAINLASLRKYGSVEVRSLEGTVDIDRILEWSGVLLHLREEAKKFQNPIEVISFLSEEEPVKFSKRILGEYYSSFFKGAGRNRKVIDGARRAQDIAYCRAWEREEEEHIEVAPLQNPWAEAPRPVPQPRPIHRDELMEGVQHLDDNIKVAPPQPVAAPPRHDRLMEEIRHREVDWDVVDKIMGVRRN